MGLKFGWRLALLSILVGGGVARSASENHRESLPGLTGVCVRVERLDASARRDGLDEQSIQTDVEQKLRLAGIKVLTASQALKESGSPTLYVRVNARLSSHAPVYAVTVTLALLQDVITTRDQKIRVREAKTWDTGHMTTYLQANLREARTVVVKDLVDEFISDWLAVNPKK